ncbi:outer membrane protein [Novosphingobium sp. NBM11]|uniref:outer membrane protein n=1 Tax=Novosphingobium sp. NBM11 TaxID=2596914 RepID=UPI00189238D1|nr:outer membrane beta-barrel protein [Novosphingobium sp. NBM11]
MRNGVTGLLTAVSLALAAQSAQAQVTTSFRGFRVEGQVGLDRFQSQGTHRNKLGYGGAGGFDGVINDRFVIGAEGSYWRGNKWTENCTSGAIGGTICTKSFNELGASVRAGVLVRPNILAYVSGGYVNNEQRKRFSVPRGQTSFYDHYRTDGYQIGGGVEYSLTDRYYVNAAYKYSQYNDHTARQRAMLGFGVRLNP